MHEWHTVVQNAFETPGLDKALYKYRLGKIEKKALCLRRPSQMHQMTQFTAIPPAEQTCG